MTPLPTGKLHPREEGVDVVMTRSFQASIEEVWTSVTSSESTARWFGRWEGDAGPGKQIRLQMLFEEGTPWCDVTIQECDAPRRLVVTTHDSYGTWRLALNLTESDGTTTLEFVHQLEDPSSVGEVGPGWEYYLDRLVAARTGSEAHAFSVYYPAQKQYYRDALASLDRGKR